MKRILPNLRSRDKKAKQGKTLLQAQQMLEKTVKEWEATYGVVSID